MFITAHKKLSLRFRRWSRKSYAAFKSMGKHVTIGHIKNIIADALLGKQKNTTTIFEETFRENNASEHSEVHKPPDDALLLMELFYVPFVQIRKKYCGRVKLSLPKYYVGLKAVIDKRFQPFYFSHPTSIF